MKDLAKHEDSMAEALGPMEPHTVLTDTLRSFVCGPPTAPVEFFRRYPREHALQIVLLRQWRGSPGKRSQRHRLRRDLTRGLRIRQVNPSPGSSDPVVP